MAINRISGNILQDDLRRGSDLAIQGNLIYFDIQNNRVGVRTSTPQDDFEVDGTLKVGNVTIDNLGNINAGGVNINDLAEPVANSDAATKFYVDAVGENSNIGNFVFASNTITLSVSPADITIQPTADSLAIIDTTSGMIVPRGNIAQRPSSAQAGTLRFNVENGFLEVYTGVTWDVIETDFSITGQVITPDGVSDTFVLDQNTTAEAIFVSINGVSQVPQTDYTVSGDLLTMGEVPLSTDIIDVRFITAVAATGSGTINPGVTDRLARYAANGTVIADTGSSLTWNGQDLAVSGNVLVTGTYLQLPVFVDGAARDVAIPSPVAGMMVLTGNVFTGYDGATWKNLSTS